MEKFYNIPTCASIPIRITLFITTTWPAASVMRQQNAFGSFIKRECTGGRAANTCIKNKCDFLWSCITTGHITTELAPHTYLYHIYPEDLESIEIKLRWVCQSVGTKKSLKDDPDQRFKFINEETESPGGLWVWSRARRQQKLTESQQIWFAVFVLPVVYIF